MEQKNRLMIVVAITLIIACAMFTSFGRNLFALDPPKVVLPGSASWSDSSSGNSSSPQLDPYHQITITPETVQNVIRTLARPASYFRESSVELFWEGGSSLHSVNTWVDSGWTHTKQALPSGAVRHDIIGEDTLYYWYDGSLLYHSVPADTQSADLAQRIPTYETVLALDAAQITSAGYELCNGLPCILVEVALTEPERTERYWISVDSGLLICAETQEADRVTYRMTSFGTLTTPCPTTASFSLPTGAVLHSVS